MMTRTFVYLQDAWDFIDRITDRIWEIVEIDGMYQVRWH